MAVCARHFWTMGDWIHVSEIRGNGNMDVHRADIANVHVHNASLDPVYASLDPVYASLDLFMETWSWFMETWSWFMETWSWIQGHGFRSWPQIQGHGLRYRVMALDTGSWAWVGPWQYHGAGWVLPLPYHPGYTTPPPTRVARYRTAVQDPAQRLALSVKTAITGSPTYHISLLGYLTLRISHS